MISFGFYPRARGGRDQDVRQAINVLYVSIHAPAGGATIGSKRNLQAQRVSIHAPAGGATELGYLMYE